MSIKERSLRIGTPVPLVGVTSEPAQFDLAKPAVIVLNSGVMHHVGACRLSVKIAREVAARGLLAVRFDYSGIGDSEPRRGSDSFEEVSLRECAEVMDHIQRTRGVKEFILYGLCSGADAAYNTALVDRRVVGMAQIDAYCYETTRFHLERYKQAATSPARVRSFIGRRIQRLLGRRPDTPAQDAVDAQHFELPSYIRVFPPRERVAAGLRALVERGVKMHVIFTGSEQHYNYAAQYRASFPEVAFGNALTVDYLPEANHIITQPTYQRLVVEQIAGFAAGVAEDARTSAPRTRSVVVAT